MLSSLRGLNQDHELVKQDTKGRRAMIGDVIGR
jgi:hypothetical protein